MKKLRHHLSVRLGITIFISAAALSFTVMATGAAYRYAFGSLSKTAGENYRHMAQLMANSVAELVNKEMGVIKAAASADAVKDAVKAGNAKYQADEKGARGYLMDLDKKWMEAPADHPLIKECLENNASLKLKSFMNEEVAGIAAIIVTDKYGGLVAASGRTPDFYQAGKEWWKEAFNAGRGKSVVGDVTFDEATRVWTIPFIVPVEDPADHAIGVCRALVNISAFFAPLEKFNVGKTGSAALVDDKAYLLFCSGAKPFINKFCEYGELQRLIQGEKKWGRLDTAYMHTRGAIAAFADVDQPLLIKSGIIWRVFVTQNADEVLSPLTSFVIRMSIFALILVALLALAGFIFGDIFVKPIKEVLDGIKHIVTGDLDFRARAPNAGDELERLVDSFNELAEKLKTKNLSIAKEEAELSRKSEELEKLQGLKEDFVAALSQMRVGAFIAQKDVESVLGDTPTEINEKHKNIIKAADRNIHKLVRKLDSLIDLTKIDTGKLSLDMKPADFKVILKSIIFGFEPRIRQKGLDIKTDIPKEEIGVYVDEVRITQVLSQLLENAIKFTKKGGIEISVRLLKDEVECSIADTGIGIERNDISRIFERFQRIAHAPGESEEGLGIGLAIARGIIVMHAGTIWIDSEINKGTKVTFSLPRYEKA